MDTLFSHNIGLATIGVCVFCAFTLVGALFYFKVLRAITTKENSNGSKYNISTLIRNAQKHINIIKNKRRRNKKIMKKYISLIVCAVLLLFAFISQVPEQQDVISGRGNGVDSKVTSAQELADVLNYFNNYEMKPIEEATVEQNNGLFNVEQELDGEEDKETKQKYTSATFYNKSKSSIDYFMSDDNSSIKQTATMTRELTANFTETAALYHSVGKIMQRQTITTFGEQIETETQSMLFDFDVDVYVTTQVCCVKFNKFDIMGMEGDDSVPNITANMLNIWFDANEIGEEMLDINQVNLDILGGMGDYFEEYKFSKFKQNNKNYVLEKSYTQEVFSILFDISFPEDVRGEFTVNLADEAQPKIRLIQSYSDAAGTNRTSSYAENNIIISYINNTVIDSSRLPKNPQKIEDYLD